jgi:hypothetical protein
MKTNAFVILLALGMVACATGSGAQHSAQVPHLLPTFTIPVSREEALNVLENTERFADIAIGYSGAPSAEVCAFGILLTQPDAVPLFERLLSDAKVAGQLYALSGLYVLDHDRYQTAIKRYETNETYVSTMFGCIIGGMKANEIVHATGPRSLDIAGGGYPKRFAEFRGCSK